MTTPTPPPPETPTPRAAWSLLLFLTLLNILNFVDRSLIASLAPLLIADLGLSRAQIGLLAGFGFVFFYTLVGLFLGLAADRWPRFPLVAAGLALWSAMTALSGLARSFVHLAIPRVFVGVGEATLTPAALSMLGDAFPRRRLGMATGVYYAGIPLGTAASLIAAGFVAPRYGWRMCFYVLGLAGLVAVAALLILKEPPRRGTAPAGPRPTLGQLGRDVARSLVERPALALVLLGGSLLVYGSGAALLVITWLVQERGFDFARAAYLAGLVAVVAGFLGNLCGGLFADWCARRFSQGRLRSLVAMTLFFTPFGFGFFLLPLGTPLFYLCWFVAAAGTTAWFGPLFSAIQELAPDHTRSTTVAFALLVMNLAGVGPGPLVTGLIGDASSLTLGLLISLGVVATAIVPFALAARQLARAAARGVPAAPGPRDPP